MVTKIPIAQIAAVLVTFNKDLVSASYIFVTLTPPKLNTAMDNMPAMTKNIKNPF